MMKSLTVLLSLMIAFTGCGKDQDKRADDIDSAMPEINTSLIAEGATIETLADGFKFAEGPAADKNGTVYFIDIPPNKVYKLLPDGSLALFKEVEGGANGLCFGNNGNLLACAWLGKELLSIDPQGEVTVLADNYKGAPLNSPNDVWADSKGGIYFTDPHNGTGPDEKYVYYLPPGDGELMVMTAVDFKPNGIGGSQDGKSVYVIKYHSEETYVYDVADDGVLSNGRFFASAGDDGMTVDSLGNVYLTNNQTRSCIEVFAPDGTLIETIETPEPPSNVCFGGADMRTLYITGITEFYSLKMKVKGI